MDQRKEKEVKQLRMGDASGIQPRQKKKEAYKSYSGTSSLGTKDVKVEDREAGLLVRKASPRTGTQIKQDSLEELHIATMKIKLYN